MSYDPQKHKITGFKTVVGTFYGVCDDLFNKEEVEHSQLFNVLGFEHTLTYSVDEQVINVTKTFVPYDKIVEINYVQDKF